MSDFKVNVDFPRNPVQGDTLEVTLTVDADLSAYKIRCQLTDSEDSNIQVATENAGGDSGDVTVSVSDSVSTVDIVFDKDQTDSFTKECNLEVEVEDSNTKVFTILQYNFNLLEEKITWTSPS